MQLLAEYNNVPMPNQGLSTKEAQDILAYLENPDAASEAERQSLVEQQKQQSPLTLPAESDSLADIMKENAHKGRLLFTGKIMFAQNGPACIQCHAVANAGVLGGGTLGPDLTQAYTKFTGPGLASLLATTPYPTMQPIYSQKPLSPEEQQNLRAFFLQASAQKPRGRGGLVFAFIFIGFVVLGALSPTIWRRRLRDVRRPLAGR